MSKTVTIGNEVIEFPEQGESAPWGEPVTQFAEAVEDVLADVQGSNDILLSQASLVNNQTTLANINGFIFNTGQVQAIFSEFLVTRTYDSGASVVTESGVIEGNFDGTTFFITVSSVGDAGMEFDITNGGQVQYKSSNLTNHKSSIIKFKAKTIDS